MATKKLRYDQVTDLISSEVEVIKLIMRLLVQYQPSLKKDLVLTVLPEPGRYGIHEVPGVTYFGLMARALSTSDPFMSVVAPPEYHDGDLYVETYVNSMELNAFADALSGPLITRGTGDLTEAAAITILRGLIDQRSVFLSEIETIRAGLEKMYGSSNVKMRELVLLINKHHRTHQFTTALQSVVPTAR